MTAPSALRQLLGYAAEGCQAVNLDEATSDELEQLTQGCNAVAFEVEGLRDRIAQAGKNGTPQPLPTKPLKPKRDPQPQQDPPKDPKKGDGK